MGQDSASTLSWPRPELLMAKFPWDTVPVKVTFSLLSCSSDNPSYFNVSSEIISSIRLVGHVVEVAFNYTTYYSLKCPFASSSFVQDHRLILEGK
jgi:hypothetical protein